MSFYPENGLNSKEDFNSDLGFIFSNSALQGIQGGYLTLISTVTGSSSLFNSWAPINNWSVEHELATLPSVTGSFSYYTGQVLGPAVNSVSGFQGIDSDITAWKVYTSYPTSSGAGSFGLGWDQLSPNSIVKTSFDNNANEITIEFDLAIVSSYSGVEWFSGYTSGQSNTLPPLSGYVGHGVLITDGEYWDFIEATPYGLRSYNHPEVALNINLLAPKRIRLGIRDNDIFISCEDGRSVVGYNKFDTFVSDILNEGAVFFGAPGKDESFLSQHEILATCSGSVGESLWDNIKVLTGTLAIFESLLEDVRYSTGFVTCYTEPFNPEVSIESFVSATVEAIPYPGGATQVSVQYSGATGWTTFSTQAITTEHTEFDLTSVPVYVYPRTNGSNDYLSNPIRFKIDQRSYSGYVLPPVINSITITASDSPINIDIVPNWKPSTLETKARIDIVTGQHQVNDPAPARWTTFLYSCPITTGLVTGFEEEKNGNLINVVGTGEVILDGPYRSSFKNYVLTGAYATSGSPAYTGFGSNYIENFYRNPLFESFRQVINTEPRFVSGYTAGELADSVYILGQYTGGYKVDFTKDYIYRLELQGQYNTQANLLGNSPSVQDFAQGVYCYPGTGTHNGTVGIQLPILSGIANGNVLVSFDLKIEAGSGIAATISGSSVSTYILPGDSYRDYSRVSLPASNNYSEMYVKLYVPSGYNQEEIKFSIDNLSVQNYHSSYLLSTGYTVPTHLSGTSYTGNASQVSHLKGATVFYTSIYLDSYPTTSGYIFSAETNHNKKLEIQINSGGYVTAIADLTSNAWSTTPDSSPFLINFNRESIVSEIKLPLSQWVNLGFIHDVHTYDMFGYATASTSAYPNTFTSTNKFVLTMDGNIVASKDVMSGWAERKTTSLEGAPYTSYIPLSGSVTVKVASGIMGRVDGTHLLNPPCAEVEADLSCLGARTTNPYYVPDVMFKEGSQVAITGSFGSDYAEGMYYNLSSPYNVSWDRSSIRNHLVLYGAEIEETSPYGDFYSTRFRSGSYAISPYSSTYERLYGLTGTIGVQSNYLNVNSGSINVFGWMYPRTEGTFFSVLQDKTDATKARLELKIRNSNLIVDKIDNTNTVVTSFTGHEVELNEWSFFDVRYKTTGYVSYGNTGAVTCYIGSNSTSVTELRTGVNYGVLYLGRSGSASQSCFKIGGTSDINLFNLGIPLIPFTGNITSYTGDKSGSYQVFMEDNLPYTGYPVLFNDYFSAVTTINSGDVGNRFFSMALFNTHNTNPKLNGIVAYDNTPFRETESYQIGYDLSAVHNVFGSTDSPIRIGNQVPATAANLARFTSPTHTVPSSISTIDLSDRNVNNLIPYKDGEYVVGKQSYFSGSSINSYRGVNSGLYSGMVDVILSGQVASADIEISTISISDPSFDYGYSCYYYYLVGRGRKVVKISSAYPHYTGQISATSTGQVPDNYFANLEKIKSSIKLKNRKGEIIDKSTYPYDITFSPYTPGSLLSAVENEENIYLDNIGAVNSGELLPDGLFTVILLTHHNRLNGESIFVHYDGYDVSESLEYLSTKEVVNPQPLFREKHYLESSSIGKFDLTLNTNSFYDLKIFGIEGSYSGQL